MWFGRYVLFAMYSHSATPIEFLPALQDGGALTPREATVPLAVMKSSSSLVLLAVSACFFLQSFANAVDWPQWRGINRDGISSEKISPANWGKEGPKQLWKKEVGTGVSSVAVTGGRLYTMGNNGSMDVVYCLDAATGAEIWKHTYPQSLGDRSFEGGPAGTPTVDGDKVYTLSHEGDLFCLAASTGKVVWKKNLPRDLNGFRQKFGYAGSPLVDGNLVIVDSGGQGASTVALDKATGTVSGNRATTRQAIPVR